MNPFLKYNGINLNGRFLDFKNSEECVGKNSFENEILSFARDLFNSSETIDIQTSGSTGKPKNLEFKKEALIRSAKDTNAYFHLDRSSKALLSLPMAYVAAKLMVVRALIGQFELLTETPSSNPLKSLDQLVAFCPMTPHQALTIFEESPEKYKLIDTVLLGGGQVSTSLQNRIESSSTDFYLGFGMAETLTHFAVRKVNSPMKQIFQLLPNVNIDTDKRGCLIVKREGITKGSLVTNDLVEIETDGFRWLGRADNLINSGGVKIVAEEVEKILFPYLKNNFFVTGMPDDKLGEKVTLFTEGYEEINLREIRFPKEFQEPRQLIQMDKFSYTESGKIKRKATIEKYLSAAG